MKMSMTIKNFFMLNYRSESMRTRKAFRKVTPKMKTRKIL